jgi:SAM-dependent methyltransferase
MIFEREHQKMAENFESGDPNAVAAHEHTAWQGAAPLYSDFIAPFTAFSGQLEIHLELSRLGSNDRVLDVGCGPGELANQLAKHAKEVIGIDFADAMISEASRRYPNLEFLQADAEQTPFDNARFDVVVVNYCAHHLARPDRVFEELHRVMTNGGRLSLIHPIQTQQPSWGSFMLATEAVLPAQALFGGPLLMTEEPEPYLSYLRGAGFRDLSCATRVKPIRMKTLEPILRGGWAVAGLNKQPQDIQLQIKQNVEQNALPYRRADGSYEFPDNVLVASALR